MKPLTAPAALLTLLMASALTHADDALPAWVVLNLQSPSSAEVVAYAASGRADDTLRVSGSNDIYRAKIQSVPAGPSGARAATEEFDKAGIYLYDFDAWAMVSSGPIIGPLRNRSYSLFGPGFTQAALNPLTMRSESLRDNTGSDNAAPTFSSYLGWRL
jgi:hypothetical protein